MTPGMVTYQHAGRLGNILFQSAATIAYAKNHGMPFTMPDRITPGKDPATNPIYLQHLVNPKYQPNIPAVTIREKQFSFQHLPFSEEWRTKNIIFDGYWQSEKYFKYHRDLILELFGFPWKLCEGFVSVHVRRGDFLRLRKKHPPVTEEWYLKAMRLFPHHRFRFFSDDIPYCERTFGDRGDCEFSTGKNEIEDLVAGSCCEHHICSASTFSWWQAWASRNPDKLVIIPKLWFVPGYGGLDTKDIVPAEWTKL